MDKKGLLKKVVKAAAITAAPAVGTKVVKKVIPAGMKAAAGIAKKISSMKKGY